jgi:polyphosphate kinase 2 (PPK2 family)
MDLNSTWKLSADDWRESERWDDFDRAYEDALSACSTENAFWHIVPTDRPQRFRDLAVSDSRVQAMHPSREAWRETLAKTRRQCRAEIEALDPYT